MNVAICDDEKNEILFIKNELNSIAAEMSITVNISEFDNSADILKVIEENSKTFDMLFLDMYIDERIGIDIASAVRDSNKRCVIIFITGFSDKMADCFEYRASAYLIKPVEKQKLIEAFKTGLDHLNHIQVFNVNSKGKHITVPFDEIMYFESSLKNIKVYHINDIEPIIFAGTIKDINAPAEYFFMCHKSFTVNFSHVKMLDKAKHDFILKNGSRIHISRKYYTDMSFEFMKFHSKVRW